MKTTTTLLVAFVSSLALATSAGAQGRGGGGGPPPGVGGGGGLGGGIGAGVGAGGIGAGIGGFGSGASASRIPPPAGATVRDTARSNSQGSAHAADIARERANANSAITSTTSGSSTSRADDARANRQGPSHASDQGVAHADAHAGLGAATTGGSLANLGVGMTVKDASGTVLGKVSHVQRSDDGTVRTVLVAAEHHRTLRLAPDTLTLNGDIATTTQLSTRR